MPKHADWIFSFINYLPVTTPLLPTRPYVPMLNSNFPSTIFSKSNIWADFIWRGWHLLPLPPWRYQWPTSTLNDASHLPPDCNTETSQPLIAILINLISGYQALVSVHDCTKRQRIKSSSFHFLSRQIWDKCWKGRQGYKWSPSQMTLQTLCRETMSL